MVLMLVVAYILSVVLTYLAQRKLLSIDGMAECYPHRFMIFLIFVPFVGLGISLILLLVELATEIEPINWKKFYRIK